MNLPEEKEGFLHRIEHKLPSNLHFRKKLPSVREIFSILCYVLSLIFFFGGLIAGVQEKGKAGIGTGLTIFLGLLILFLTFFLTYLGGRPRGRRRTKIDKRVLKLSILLIICYIALYFYGIGGAL